MGLKSRGAEASSAAAAENGAAANGQQQQQPSRLARMKLTDAEKKRLQEMIRRADSLQEIIRLEKMLNEGTLPPGVHLDDVMEE